MTRSLAGATLLLAVLAGCGGGSDGAAQDTAPAAAVAGLEEETGGAPAGSKPGAAPEKVKIDPSLIPEPGAPLVRETYEYVGGPRDPFASVLEGVSIGPELADLDVVSITMVLRDQPASVAVLRDRTNGKRYTVREGERLGRARVSDIRPKDVSFTIDDYGTQRRVTLALRKREEITP